MANKQLVVCGTCGAERKCSPHLAEQALKGDITCVKCAAAGKVGYFVHPKVLS